MCVLVVEDEFLIRLILVEELRDAGYEVKEAETAQGALELLETLDPALSVLVTDIHMPGDKTGLDLAAYVRGHMPKVPIIFTTGRPDVLASVRQLDARQMLVRKPYEPAEIISRIRELVA